MALDRQSIEKKDFPIGRRGYDPEAVDAHLRAVADEVETLRRSARRSGDSVASSASDQVRAILAAAEASAAEIRRQAEEEAREIRDDATAEAKRTREEADQHAHDYVGRVAEATSALLQRVDAMQGELNTLLDTLRTGAHRVNADLQLLEGHLGELAAATGRERYELPSTERVAVEDAAASAQSPADPDALVPDPNAPSAAATRERSSSAPAPSPADPAPAVPSAADDAATEQPAADASEESARLVALDMALSGTPREETDRYLAEHFDLPDRAALLDEVYATVGG